MKQIISKVVIFLTVFLLFSYSTSARLLPSHQEDKLEKANEMITTASSSMNMQEDELLNLMGLEECEEKDEDCLKRRVVAEAHLDYIYTQRHKPKGSP
ncbi:Phytosulfokine-beta like [Actinidia chinensis var. chinensis]|uniref:Phytosulfokine n=1 Tax=Actinidia chinensis var. chinensis TaxID=1590841 RepID=A0A2R6PX48_ACTCC|nr:putative phytosulfokines 6 [Actinidia eriantha]PSR98341.1 Phytosulfokine-beta like [Actinidia chinensis var. chinensis]